VHTSLLQAQIFMLDFQAARWLIKQDVPKQAGNNHPTSIPTGVFTTADGYINVATTGGAIWERFARAIGADALLQRSEYRTAEGRSEHRDALNAEIDRVLKEKPSAEWIDILNKAGVPCGPIYSIDQVFSDPQVEHLGIAQKVATNGSDVTVVGQPVALSRTPSRIAVPTPGLGEQTEEVLAEFGFSKEEISALHQAKVV
jgi:crotonobetainyl-CoA:carnitine CoA-transferase CaiB-like acyl-CoA transferase